MRPCEPDALTWPKIDVQAGTILVDRQWNAKAREFVFTTLRGSHYRPSSRSHHWNRVRCAAGGASTDFYLATRHYFCW